MTILGRLSPYVRLAHDFHPPGGSHLLPRRRINDHALLYFRQGSGKFVIGGKTHAIAPGIVPTELNRALLETARGKELLTRTPMGRFGAPEEMVGTAVYLASDASAFVTGQIIAVDGGYLASGVNQ